MVAHMGHEGMVKILLDKTPEVEELEDIARILLKDSRLKYGSNGHVSPGCIWPLLTVALRFSRILLEQSDIDVNAVMLRNSTALDLAARARLHPEAVQLLLSHRRVDLAVRNGFGLVQPDAPLDPVDHQIIELFNSREFDIFD